MCCLPNRCSTSSWPRRRDDWTVRPVVRELQAEARAQGLWNLFLPGGDGGENGGAGLTNLQYAPVAEVTGWSPRLAPAAFNCAAPDTGNMEVLNDFGTPAQKAAWLEPLLDAAHPLGVLHDRARRGVVRRDEHRHPHPPRRRPLRHHRPQVVVDRRDEPRCGDLHRHGQDRSGCRAPPSAVHDPRAARHRGRAHRAPAQRVRLRRPRPRRSRRDRLRRRARARRRTSSRGEGDGFAIAQARLGPGRIHHCMRALGMGERALALMRRARVERGTRSAARSPSRAWCASGSPSPASSSRRCACSCSRPRGSWTPSATSTR